MKRIKRRSFLPLNLLLPLIPLSIHAQTNISGMVSGTWDLPGSPYVIVGDASVPAGSTLLIEAGVSVQFTGEYALEIFGNIQAIGTQQDSIGFISTSTWSKGLHITNGQDTCRFKHCIFKDFRERTAIENVYYSGGALHATNTPLLIEDCSFRSNFLLVNTGGYNVIARGGAICLENCPGCMRNSAFVQNKIDLTASMPDFIGGNIAEGGAIYSSGTLRIQCCHITQNLVEFTADGMDIWVTIEAHGGGICTTGTVENCLVSDNGCDTYIAVEGWTFNVEAKAKSFGGGIYGGSLIRNNSITANYCQSEGQGSGGMGAVGAGRGYSYGGGLYGGTVVEHNMIWANQCTSLGIGSHSGSAESFGGGLCETSDMNNNLVRSNSCSAQAAGPSSISSTARGGGILGGTMRNNTVAGNSVSASGGQATAQGSGIYGGTVRNCIVYGNILAPQVSSATTTYSCVEGGYAGTGNISDDPLFVTGTDGDYYLSQVAAGQSQQSPCVDAGDPSTCLYLGTTRTDTVPDFGIVDMGFHYPTATRGVDRVEVRVMLQGPFEGSEMQTSLNSQNYLPLIQPYADAPWNYNGTELVTSIPNASIVDWVLLELRQAPMASQAVPGTRLCRQACLLDKTGKVTGLEGNSSLPVALALPQVLDPGNDLFVIVWHRNHLGVLSASPMTGNGVLYSYDFTTGAEQAYGGVNGHLEVGLGIWGMVSGDGDANGQINNVDKVDVWKPQGGFSGYRAGDFNLDGQVDNQDKVDLWKPNSGRSSQVEMGK
jgi:hypothetical protein